MNSVFSFAPVAYLLAALLSQEPVQARQATEGKYPLEAILVLTPDQCETQSKKGNWVIGKEKYQVGEFLCPAAEAAVQQVFEKYTRVETLSDDERAPGKVILTPRFVDLEATRTATAFGRRKMVLLVEWTATDHSGKVLWVQTVEGNSHEKTGNLFT